MRNGWLASGLGHDDSRMKVVSLNLWRRLLALQTNSRGQDLIEYALMAGFVATAVATMSQSIAASFATVMSKVNSVVVVASSS